MGVKSKNHHQLNFWLLAKYISQKMVLASIFVITILLCFGQNLIAMPSVSGPAEDILARDAPDGYYEIAKISPMNYLLKRGT